MRLTSYSPGPSGSVRPAVRADRQTGRGAASRQFPSSPCLRRGWWRGRGSHPSNGAGQERLGRPATAWPPPRALPTLEDVNILIDNHDMLQTMIDAESRVDCLLRLPVERLFHRDIRMEHTCPGVGTETARTSGTVLLTAVNTSTSLLRTLMHWHSREKAPMLWQKGKS
jgi:hypothetical protein